jgi:WD40 repeat protein
VRIRDIATGTVSPAIGPRVEEHAFDVSPDGRSIAYFTDPTELDANGDAVNVVLDLATGDRRFVIDAPVDLDGVNWSPDSQYLAANAFGSGSGIVVLDAQGRSVATLPSRDGYEPWSTRFAPDGDRLIAIEGLDGSGGTPESGRITVWDWRLQSVITTIDVPFAQDLAIDPSGRRVATGFGVPVIVDLETGARVELEGVDGALGVTFSPDGTQLAVATGTSVRLLDSTTGRQRLVLRSYSTALIDRLAFSPDGKMLAAHANDGVRVWALDVDDLIAIGHRELTRTWKEAECRQFLHLERCPP